MKRTAQRAKRTLAIMTLALAGCRGPIRALSPTPEVVPIRFVTTYSTAPLLHSLAANYKPNETLVAIIDYSHDGLTIQQLLNDSSNDTSPRYALTTYLEPQSNLWAAPIGQDAIAIISHPEVSIERLTAHQLRQIFTGHIQKWSEIGAGIHNIVVVSQTETSPTRQVFEEIVLGNRPTTYAARLAPSPQAMLDVVASTPGAIGYLSAALVNERVRVIPISDNEQVPAFLPSLENIQNETYPLRMPLLVVGARPPTVGDGYYEFILWMQTEGQSIIAENYAPLAKP
jgi:ABC-type phosphate transport system substrate-binding protein